MFYYYNNFLPKKLYLVEGLLSFSRKGCVTQNIHIIFIGLQQCKPGSTRSARALQCEEPSTRHVGLCHVLVTPDGTRTSPGQVPYKALIQVGAKLLITRMNNRSHTGA